MKKLLLLIPVFAIAICLYAFKAEHKQQTVEWFDYNGGGTNTPGNYTYAPTPSCPSGTAVLCRIHVLSDGGSTQLPEADALDAMQTEINNAVSGHTETSDVKLKAAP
ncbi:MAG TPA: hypothetical protein VLC98_11550 [Phnomibacter sp.]|nr:hypothetical protein [Phnomibacter sp.]